MQGLAGNTKNIFSKIGGLFKNYGITQTDLSAIKEFNRQLSENVGVVEAWKNTMGGATKAGKQMAVEVRKGHVSVDDLSNSLSMATVKATLLNAALSFGIMLVVQWLITGIEKLTKLIPNVENTTEWLKHSAEEVKNVQNDINSLNSELTTTKSRIEELQSKPKLTLVEQNELENLKRQNAELQRQIDLKKIALVTAQDANAKEFVKAFDARATRDPSEDKQWYHWAFPFINAFTDTYAMFRGTDSQVYKKNLEEYDEYQREYLKKADASKNALRKGNNELAKSEDEAAKKAKEKMDAKSAEMSEYVKGLSELREQLGEYDYNTLDDDAKYAVDYITWAENSLAIRKGHGESVFSSIINSQKFAEGKKALDQLAESGNLTAESLEKLYHDDETSNLSAMIDYLKVMGLMADTSSHSFKLLANQINSANKSVNENGSAIENATENASHFKALMEEKGTDKDPSFVESIEKTVEQFQKLEDALVKFESGSLTDSDRMSLFKAFPQLTAYADNLGEGIRNLLDSMRGDVVSQFAKQVESFKADGATEEDIAQLEAYQNTILRIADSADSLKNALDSVRTVFNDLDEIVKDYNENQYFSIDSLEKLGENGQRYLSYLTYENNQLKINEDAYKKLVLAQIDEVETKATLQATSDLQSLTDEATAKEYLAKVNIDLAKSQLSAAQAAFQYTLALKLAEGGGVAQAAQKIADNLNTLRNIFASAREQADSYSYAMLGAKSATEKKAQASEKAKAALEAEQHALEHSKEALEREKKALEDNKKAYEKAQKAIEDLIEWTQKYIKQVKDDEIKSLQEKKEKFDELIEKQKEALQAEKDLHEFEKSISEKHNTVASNALSVSIASLDDSSAGKKAHKEALDEYKKSETDLKEFLYDHEIETRTKALDQLKEDTDKTYDDQIKSLQDYLNDEVQLYRDACAMIDNDNGELYGNLLDYALRYTTTGKTEFDRMWSLAQTAMDEYNVASVGTMQFMDELKGRIYDVDDAVDILSQNIQTYEDRISGVKNQLDDLKDAAIEAKNAIDIANSTPLTGDLSKGGDKSFWVRYNGKVYDTNEIGKFYNGDTTSNRLLAASELTKMIAKDVSGFDNYGLSIVQGLLGVGGNKTGHHWTYTYNGVEYESRATTKASAIADIRRQLAKKYGNSDFVLNQVNSKIRGYESGTNSAFGGVSLVGERGAELRVLNRGDGILKNQIVRGLTALGTNPAQFLAEAGQKMLATVFGNRMKSDFGAIAGAGSISPSINIVVQGDATQSTVNALKAQAQKIMNDTLRLVQADTLKRTHSNRVR